MLIIRICHESRSLLPVNNKYTHSITKKCIGFLDDLYQSYMRSVVTVYLIVYESREVIKRKFIRWKGLHNLKILYTSGNSFRPVVQRAGGGFTKG